MRVPSLLIVLLSTLLAACASPRTSPAPIIDGQQTPQPAPVATPIAAVATPSPAQMGNKTHTVQKGDTLYRIATLYGVTTAEVQRWNQLSDSGIKIGQVLVVAAPLGEGGVTVTPLQDAAPSKAQTLVTPQPPVGSNTPAITKTHPKAVKEVYSPQAASQVAKLADGNTVATKQQAVASSATASITKPVAASAVANSTPNPNKAAASVASSATQSNTNGTEFGMPTSGKVIRKFSEESKGIDIAGKLGQSIVASAQGKVVYAGAGLRGYGKMIILQHSNGYLTAYAHNDKLLVKEGDVVKKGEKIAEMGKSDADQVKLHFEVRKGGKPVDPAKFIATE
ncbi:peptidoglycan DD-metalloendopeptidase family protein [Chitinibacter sp. ZOR0017]|uniref:peptidoglycan DD-metalloendopeptidase family protein n=1 Tax=Chitinibacter sp. ZOR0017 TaxID=1339254 RepID=UPI0006456AB2|nr:peptidoglycan DD-metalloendopeptidase family protein [Chitinibacter sp. ZOR0017]